MELHWQKNIKTRRCHWKTDEEVEYLSASLATVDGLVKEVGNILQDVKGTLFHLSHSQIAPESTTSQQFRVARRKKENVGNRPNKPFWEEREK